MLKPLASYLDHTLLKPEATEEEISELCQEAVKYNFYAVCVNSSYVKIAARVLQESAVKVCAVVGFPLGAASTAAKVCEAREAVKDGASELDMVIHIGALIAGRHAYVMQDIEKVVEAAGQAPVKVIIETGLLNTEQKRLACQLAVKGGASFVKTSTGFGHGGATLEDVRLMRQTVGSSVGVKASGGVRTAQAAKELIEAGASRIGTSSGPALVGEESH